MEQLENLCVSHVEPILTYALDLNLVDTINKMNQISLNMDLPYPQIIAGTEYELEKSRVMFTGHKDWLSMYTERLKEEKFALVGSYQLGLFISGFGLSSSNYEQEVFEMLKKSKIKILKYIKDAKGLLLVYSVEEKQEMIRFIEKLI